MYILYWHSHTCSIFQGIEYPWLFSKNADPVQTVVSFKQDTVLDMAKQNIFLIFMLRKPLKSQNFDNIDCDTLSHCYLLSLFLCLVHSKISNRESSLLSTDFPGLVYYLFQPTIVAQGFVYVEIYCSESTVVRIMRLTNNMFF